jgi:hypothetical protein
MMAFRETGLVNIVIPLSVEFLGDGCFCDCNSLSSITLEPGSRLLGIQKSVFEEVPIVIKC